MSSRAQTVPQSKKQTTNLIDERLRRITRDILPSAPYQLRIDIEFRRDNRQAIEWRRSCPFEPHEEQLQYLTFRSNFDKDTIFHAVGDWDDGNGNIMSKIDKSSGLNTPLPGQAPKKKISLSDYKNKAAGHVGPVAASSRASGEAHLFETGSKAGTVSQSASKPPTSEPPHGLKRPLAADVCSEYSKKNASPPHPPPSKKVHMPLEHTPVARIVKIEDSATWQLPPMLSPTLPPDIEEQLAKLPAAGGLIGHRKPASETKVPEKLDSLNLLSSKDDPQNEKETSRELAQDDDQPERIALSLKATKSSHEKPPKSPSIQRAMDVNSKGLAISRSLVDGPGVGDKKTSSLAISSVQTPQKLEKKSLIAKLRIPKSIRKNCIRILQMQSRPARKLDQDVSRSEEMRASTGKSRDRTLTNGAGQTSEPQNPRLEHPQGRSSPSTDRNGRKNNSLEESLNTPKSGEKRKKPLDQGTNLEPATKRQKQPAGLDLSQKPHTPIGPSLRSPLVSQHSSAQKSQLSTPKRDLKGAAMHRIGSSEGDVKTPLGATRGGTPTANGTSERINREGRSSSNTSSGGAVIVRNEDVTTWRAEQKKYEGLGRKLKHEARAFIPEDGDFTNDTPSMRQGVAVAFEAILAFMLSFAIGDEIKRLSRHPTDVTPWRTLLPFLHYVQKVTRMYRPLLGLTHQLEAVCRDTICLCDGDRLERDALLPTVLDDQRPPTSESNAPNISPPATEKAKNDFANFRAKHVENLRQAQHMWQLGYTELSVREMQRSFPLTWGKSADSPGPGKGKENLSPKTYGDGPYYLPLGPTTTGIEGVRAGWQMLQEWTKKNEVKWQGKMGI
ncbi:MAG: hypothetical protein Q9195_005890 [Heterodermia aff. obscurata]